jgi:N-methylhydantoinase B
MNTKTFNPITLNLIKNALESTVDEMALTIVRTAYSSNLKNSMDFSTGFCSKQGELIAQGLCLPLHLGSLPDGMRAILKKYGGKIYPGDVFILNDPYEGGTHLPDIYVIKPIFVNNELLAFATTIAHHTDIGGRVAGGNACDCTEIYQEGLRIPPLKLYEQGKANEALFDIIAQNVRVPVNSLGDLRAQLSACHIGERGFMKLMETYGQRILLMYMEELLNYTEQLVRAGIKELPDGVFKFTDYIDDDGIEPDPIPIKIKITISGDSLTADFAGTAKQVKGGINSPIPFTKSAVYACVRCLLPLDIPTNSGLFRPLKVLAPEGTVINPVMPAPVAARGLTGFRLANVVCGALAQVAPDKIPAAEVGGDTGISIGGYDADGDAFVFLEFLFGAWGGRPDKDGIDGNASIVVNFSNNPAEVIEAEYPLMIEEYGFVPDSGGAGQYRGGLAVVRQYQFTGEEAVLQIRSDRRKFLPYGLAGGKDGTPSMNILNPEMEHRMLPSKTLLTIKRGDVLKHILAGAGGWGNPTKRDVQKIIADIRDDKITVEYAKREYGMNVDLETMEVKCE